MKFNPKKRVGSPASVRGIRGTYLLYTGGYLLCGLFGFLVIGSLSLPLIFKGVAVVIIIGFIFYKILDYMKLSKGDMQKPIKDSCRISVIIKK